jgi:hypothetical protein
MSLRPEDDPDSLQLLAVLVGPITPATTRTMTAYLNAPQRPQAAGLEDFPSDIEFSTSLPGARFQVCDLNIDRRVLNPRPFLNDLACGKKGSYEVILVPTDCGLDGFV